MNRKVLANIFFLGVLQVFNVFIPFLWLRHLAQVLDLAFLGQICFAFSVAQVCIVFSDFGFSVSGPKMVALQRNNAEKLTEIFLAVTLIRIVLACVFVFLMFLVLYFLLGKEYNMKLIALACFSVLGNAIYPQWFFQGLEAVALMGVVQVLIRVGSLIATSVFVLSNDDVFLAAILQAMVLIVGSVACFPLWRHKMPQRSIKIPSFDVLIDYFRGAWDIYISTALISLYTSCNSFFVGIFLPSAELAQFHIADRIVRASHSMYAAVSDALFPYSVRVASESSQVYRNYIDRLFVLLVPLSIVFAAVFFVLMPQLVFYVFGTQYSMAAHWVGWYSLSIILIVVSNLSGIHVLYATHQESVFNRIIFSSSLMNFLVFIPSVMLWGGQGAVVANLLIEFFVAMMMIFVLRRCNFIGNEVGMGGERLR